MRFIGTLIFFLLSYSVAFANLPYTPVTFPRDEAAHWGNIPYSYDTIIEWWYYNGKLTTDEGKNLSFDLALFNPAKKKFGVVVNKPILHIQVADLDNKQAYGVKHEYGLDTGDVSDKTLDITVEKDFALHKTMENGKTIYVLKAQGTEKNTTLKLDLKFEPISQPFLINESGLMPMPDNTNSYYYTIPQFKTTGTVTINNSTYQITKTPGSSWMDHQWGDFNLDHYGWEWFSVRLENGFVANVFLNYEFATKKVVSGLANVILPNGQKKYIPYTDFTVVKSNYWYDEKNGISYPMTFNFNFPTLNLTMQTDAAFPQQELHGYWEGYCNTKAIADKKDVNGFAYMEIVYHDQGKKFNI